MIHALHGNTTPENVSSRTRGAASRSQQVSCEPCGQNDGSRARVQRTRAVWQLIGCPFNHRHPKVRLTGAGSDRRYYRCGQCQGEFSQRTPGATTFEERDATWKPGASEPSRSKPRSLVKEGRVYMRPAGGGKPHIGDVRLRFHNSGGIADERKRTRYLRRMAQKVDLLALTRHYSIIPEMHTRRARRHAST